MGDKLRKGRGRGSRRVVGWETRGQESSCGVRGKQEEEEDSGWVGSHARTEALALATDAAGAMNGS